MIFEPLELDDVLLVKHDLLEDKRGFFARSFCTEEFRAAGVDIQIVQANSSFSSARGTLRGIHYQLEPHSEVKVVRCIQGAIYDVVVDLRKSSPTFLQWCGVELNQSNRHMLCVPKGFGHSFISLTDNTEIIYLVSEKYSPQAERTALWNDPVFDIDWPLAPTNMSEKDANARPFDEGYHLGL